MEVSCDLAGHRQRAVRCSTDLEAAPDAHHVKCGAQTTCRREGPCLRPHTSPLPIQVPLKVTVPAVLSSLAQCSQATCCYFVGDHLRAVLPLTGPCTRTSRTRNMIKQQHFCAGQQPDLRSRVVKPFSPTGPKAPNAFISAASSNGKSA